ncbi:MAG: radical SAM family heme chaperone HemW [Opitutales bacterium]
MTLQAKVHESTPPVTLGVYVHVPFCASTCDFCAFYQEKPQRQELERYLAAVEGEMRLRHLERPANTVFWGGGTPGLLPSKDLKRLAHATRTLCQQSPEEWTVEMAPSTVKADKVDTLLNSGVTRMSMGVQSFQAKTLDALGRLHSPDQARKAYATLRAGGCDNINLDLIFAIPGQSLDAWAEDLKAAIALEPEHISTYCLTFEEDTALWLKLNKGQVRKQSVEDEAAFYEITWEILEKAGYAQYEVSNFARPGYACQHNLNTWAMHEWVGYGPSAASQCQGERLTNPHDLNAWVQGIEVGKPTFEERIQVSDPTLFVDAWIFGLRTNAGVDRKLLEKRFPSAWDKASLDTLLSALCEANLLQLGSKDHYVLTPQGRLLADAIAEQFMDLPQR